MKDHLRSARTAACSQRPDGGSLTQELRSVGDSTSVRHDRTLREMIRATVSALPSGPESESEPKGKK